MSRLLTIAQRELVSMFRVPAGWIILALFAFLTGVLFVNMTVIPGQPGSMRYFFSYASWLLIPIAPAISMRLISEEYRSGSFESLRTTPAGDWAVSLGKYLASVAFLVLMLVPTLVFPLTLHLISDPAPDLGPVASGYLMLILVGSLYLAVGLVASALTPSQTLAFLGTLMALILWMVVTSLVAPRAGVVLGDVLGRLSIASRINELSKGVIDTSTIAFFLLGILWMLVLTAGVLEAKRLGRSKLVVVQLSIVFVLATGCAVFFAGVLTTRNHARIDVTATGAHRLSPRAESMVDRLTGPTELVLAIDMSRADRRSVDLVVDVLEAYDRSSTLVSAQTIDLGSADGQHQTRALIDKLADRQREQIDENLRTLTETDTLLSSLASSMAEIAPSLEDIGENLDPGSQLGASNKAFFEQRAALMRVSARELTAQQKMLSEQLQSPTGVGDMPDFEAIASPLADGIARAIAQVDDLAEQLTSFADASTIEPAPRSLARPLITRLQGIRDRASIAHTRVRTIERIDAQRVGRAIQTGEALLVIGPVDQGISAVDLEAVLLPAAGIERAGGSAAGIIGPRTQELVASAIAQLVIPEQPILVLVHGYKPGELLGASNFFQRTVAQLAQHGVQCVEWAAVEQPQHPNLSSIDPSGLRPVVYMVIAVDSAAGAGESSMNGAKRATAMASVVSGLVEQGRPVLLSLNPSVFPTFGDPDPMSAITKSFGIVPDFGRTILHDRAGSLGRIASPVSEVVQPEVDEDANPIADALHGLNTVLPWAIPIAIENTPDAHAQAIITMPGDNETWSESRWLRLRSTPNNARELMRDQPVYDEGSDIRASSWILAAAGERRIDGATQRMIVVGSNGWANDAVAFDAEQLVEGRVTRKYPGNAVLLESSISWLSGMDDLIAPGADARPIAMINPLDQKRLSMLRWILLAGIPGLVLLIGMATRLVFG
ncbi:MAG: ABC transporter permease subunit [Phycisphaerales bacterium]|nr:ABC transporter permease subunit [Phycisphaerales bacterium]